MFKINSGAFIEDHARLPDVEMYDLPTNRVVSSDRYVINPSSTMQGPFGYDMVCCLIPIDADFTSIADPEWQTRITEGSEILDRNPYIRSDRILKLDEFPELTFKVQVRDNGSLLRLEFNPSKIRHELTELGTLEDIRYGIKLACARLSQDVLPEWSVNRETGEIYNPSSWPTNWETAVKITRLDVTFDFLPGSPQRLLDSLLKVSPKYNMKVWAIYFKGKLESLTIPYGKTNGRIVLYNKHTQDSRFPKGTIRFEVQARNQMLKKHGLTILSKITDERAIELLETRLGLALWDTPIYDLENRAEAVEGKSIPWSRKIQLLGYLEARDSGIDLGIPERTKKQYEKEIRELGLT